MNMCSFIPFKAASLCVAFALVLRPAPSALAAENAESEGEVTTLELAPGLIVPLAKPSPLDWQKVSAERLILLFLDQLRSDPSDELEYRRSVILELIDAEEFELAEQIASGIRQDDRAEVLGEIAFLYAGLEREERAAILLEEAESWLVHSTGMHKEMALRFIAACHARLGNRGEAEELMKQITDAFARQRVRGEVLSAFGEESEIETFLKETGEPWVLPQIDLLVDFAERKLRDGEVDAADKLLIQAGEKAFGLKKLTGFERVGRIVELLLEHKAMAKASWHLEAYIRGIKSVAPEMPERGVLLARAARFSRALGKIELAESLLDDAESNIKNVFVLYAARPLAAIARERVALGDKNRAFQLIDIAARTSAAYDHIRGKAMGAVWVCLFCHLTELSMEDAVREQMRLAAGA